MREVQGNAGVTGPSVCRILIYYLIVFAGVSEEVSEEVEAGTFSDQDEVGGAVGQVSGR